VVAVSAVAADDRRLLSDAALRVLRDAVLDGVLLPGERLHDGDLVAWLGVSRTPIRSALDRLQTSGLIELAANRWTRVRAPDAAWLADSASIVAALHRAAAVGAVSRLDGEFVDAVLSGLVRARPVVSRSSGRVLTLEVLRRVGHAVGGVTSRSSSGVLSSALDDAELRLAHGLRSLGCTLEVSAWDVFVASAESSLVARDADAWGDAVAELLRRVASTAG
jgi:DNA-binding GntR family transcriptional regulator